MCVCDIAHVDIGKRAHVCAPLHVPVCAVVCGMVLCAREETHRGTTPTIFKIVVVISSLWLIDVYVFSCTALAVFHTQISVTPCLKVAAIADSETHVQTHQ